MAGLRVPEKRSGGMPQYRQQPAYNTTPGANLGARLSDSAGGIAAQGAQAGWQAVINTGKAVQGAAKVGFDLYTEYSRTKGSGSLQQISGVHAGRFVRRKRHFQQEGGKCA